MNSQRLVWTIAGTDPSGGAGILADVKTFHGLECYGCAVITSVISQNTVGVRKSEPVSRDLLEDQLEALAQDMPPSAIKIGLLPNTEAVKVVAQFLKKWQGPVVYDPVMSAGSGHTLTREDIRKSLMLELLPFVTVLTPNRIEAEQLTGKVIESFDEMLNAARILRSMGVKAVLLKGGHLPGETVATDLLCDGNSAFWLSSPRRADGPYHGTGCTLSSAITVLMAHGLSLRDSVILGKAYVNQGMRLAPPCGRGRRPLYHGSWPQRPEDLPIWGAAPVDPRSLAPCSPLPQPLGLCLEIGSPQEIPRWAEMGVRTFWISADTQEHDAHKHIAAIAKHWNVRVFFFQSLEGSPPENVHGVVVKITPSRAAKWASLLAAGIPLGIEVCNFTDLATAAGLKPSFCVVRYDSLPVLKGSREYTAGLLAKLAGVPTAIRGDLPQAAAKDLKEQGVSGIVLPAHGAFCPSSIDEVASWLRIWEPAAESEAEGQD